MQNKILNLILILEDWISKETLYLSEIIISELSKIKEENSLILFYSWFKNNKENFIGLDDLTEFDSFLWELYTLNRKLFSIKYADFIQDLISYNLFCANFSSHNLKEDLRSKHLFLIFSIIENDIEEISDDIRCLKKADNIKTNLNVEDY
jgi:hypothetical protein